MTADTDIYGRVVPAQGASTDEMAADGESTGVGGPEPVYKVYTVHSATNPLQVTANGSTPHSPRPQAHRARATPAADLACVDPDLMYVGPAVRLVRQP